MIIAELIQKFLKHCTRNGCKTNTLRQYTTRVNQVLIHFGNVEWNTIEREQLLDYLYEFNHFPDKKPKSNSTQRANIIALQLLEDYASEFHSGVRKLTDKDKKKPAIGKRETLPTSKEVRDILSLARKDFSLIYRALRLTGARPNELVNAQIEDIQNDNLCVKQHKTSAKTGEPRNIPIGSTVLPIFEAAKRFPEDQLRTTGNLFLDHRAKPWTVPQLSRMFRAYRRELKLSESIVFYCTRHEFGSAVTKKFGLNQASELLGHTNITTTQRYAHMTADERKEIQSGAIDDITGPQSTSETKV